MSTIKVLLMRKLAILLRFASSFLYDFSRNVIGCDSYLRGLCRVTYLIRRRIDVISFAIYEHLVTRR